MLKIIFWHSGAADRQMQRWHDWCVNALWVVLFLSKTWTADCCFAQTASSDKPIVTGIPCHFHKWIELSQIICHSFTRSRSILLCMMHVCAAGEVTHPQMLCHVSPSSHGGSSRPRISELCLLMCVSWVRECLTVCCCRERDSQGQKQVPAGPSRSRPAASCPLTLQSCLRVSDQPAHVFAVDHQPKELRVLFTPHLPNNKRKWQSLYHLML